MGYCSYFGKKIDPEPGRCRRTDGKKWRCSKDAHPDSKYCERHMNRGRYRSRKLVEFQTTSQSLSTVSSGVATGSNSSSGCFQNTSMQSIGNRRALCFGSNPSHLLVDPIPYAISTNEYSHRYIKFGYSSTSGVIMSLCFIIPDTFSLAMLGEYLKIIL